MVSWPSPPNLPASAQWGWTQTPMPNVITSFQKSRRKYTTAIRTYQVQATITAAQLLNFYTFWSAIKDGADKFTWERPNDQTPVNFKPLPGSVYNVQHIEGSTTDAVYRVSMTLMEVP